jgi:hypothetical protein
VDTGVDEKILLKWILQKHDMKINKSFESEAKNLGTSVTNLNYITTSMVGAGNFSLRHRVQNGSGAHPASYPMGTRGSFLGGKAAGS